MNTSALIQRPIIIVSSPRAGSSLLFETLSRSPDLWTIGGESHAVIEGIPRLHPSARGWHSNVLRAEDADLVTAQRLRVRFTNKLRDRTGRRPIPEERPMRLLEKTPRNALRVPFLAKVFPRARFVYLYRSAAETIASMLEGWRSGYYVSYPELPGWVGPAWSFLLVPTWRQLIGRSLVEVAARQWAITTKTLLDDLEVLQPHRWLVTRYDNLVANPAAEITRLCRALDLAWDQPLDGPLPASRSTLTPPRAGKWLSHQAEIEAVWPLVDQESRRALAVAARGLPVPP